MERLNIDAGMEFDSARRAIVACRRFPYISGSLKNRIAWVVTMSSSLGSVEVMVDDEKEKILRVVRHV
jgi:hypothetical protein